MADEFEVIEELRQELSDSNANLKRAAMAGKQLLEENQQLGERYELDMEECNKRIESLEQDKYTLHMQLESKDHMEKHYEAELSNASERTKMEVTAITDRLQMTHANESQKLKSLNDSLKADLDLIKLKETQLQEKIQCLEERLEQSEACQNKTFLNMTTNMEDQVAALLEQTAQLEVEKLLLNDKMARSEEICKQQEMIISSSNKRMEELQEISEDRHRQCVSYQHALEECRERLEEKRAELELFRLESQDPNRKGNSLFAEVEIKRHEIEKKYISLSVQFESTKKRAMFHKQRIQELKLQVANLLQTDNGRVSVTQVKEVREALMRTRQQNQTLLQKLNESEGTKSTKMPQPHQIDTPLLDSHFEGGLAFLLEQAKKESDKLRKELKTERMMRMTSETKESEYQVRFNDMKKELDKSKAVNIKMELKISDLRERIKMKRNSGVSTTDKEVKGGNLEKVSIARTKPVSQMDEDKKTTIADSDHRENHQEQPMTSSSDVHGIGGASEDVINNGVGEVDQIVGNYVPDNGGTVGADNSRSKKRQYVESESKTKKVSINEDVEVIGSDETLGHSVLQDHNSDHSRTVSPKKSKKSRNRVVYVNKGSQNECKQQ